jgi:hypothetical protein
MICLILFKEVTPGNLFRESETPGLTRQLCSCVAVKTFLYRLYMTEQPTMLPMSHY